MKLALYHLRLSLGFFLVALAQLSFPKPCEERRCIAQSLKPFEWEANVITEKVQ